MRVLAIVAPWILAIGCFGIGCEGLRAESTVPGSLTELSWIAGEWLGDEGDTRIQEIWSQPDGGAMIGMFRLVQNDQPVFYEFMAIELTDGGPVMKIKHFNPDFVGWEEKQESVVLELKELTSRKAVFEAERDGNPEFLTYERTGDALVLTLEKPAKDSRSEFRFKRAEP